MHIPVECMVATLLCRIRSYATFFVDELHVLQYTRYYCVSEMLNVDKMSNECKRRRTLSKLHDPKKVNWNWRLTFIEWPIRVTYNRTFDFVTGQFVKLLSPTCSWKMSITPNCLEYFDKILHMHWYWRHLVQEIAKWHLLLVEALPSAKFWKSENSPISWTEWNILINFCVNININKI